jgi:hypothetical protein
MVVYHKPRVSTISEFSQTTMHIFTFMPNIFFSKDSIQFCTLPLLTAVWFHTEIFFVNKAVGLL